MRCAGTRAPRVPAVRLESGGRARLMQPWRHRGHRLRAGVTARLRLPLWARCIALPTTVCSPGVPEWGSEVGEFCPLPWHGAAGLPAAPEAGGSFMKFHIICTYSRTSLRHLAGRGSTVDLLLCLKSSLGFSVTVLQTRGAGQHCSWCV